MAVLSKEDILGKKDLETKVVHVPEWGGDVILSTMTGYALDKLATSAGGKSDMSNFRARLVAACLVDEAGKQLFSDDEVIKLGKKSSKVLNFLFNECQKLNKLGDEEVEQEAKK